jgi:hypothetical protein
MDHNAVEQGAALARWSTRQSQIAGMKGNDGRLKGIIEQFFGTFPVNEKGSPSLANGGPQLSPKSETLHLGSQFCSLLALSNRF